MSDWTPREQWPQWLQDARTDGALVRVVGGLVHWHGGDWHDGVWHDGVWHDGDWHDGTWYGGVWRGGDWHDGTWYGGVWRGGDWHSGTWYGGVWRGCDWLGGTWYGGVWLGGTWRGGEWLGGRSSVRSKYIPMWDGSRIHIGCKSGTIPEWDAWFAGDEQYETPRDTETFRLIHAHYQAIRAWVVAMGWHGEAAQ